MKVSPRHRGGGRAGRATAGLFLCIAGLVAASAVDVRVAYADASSWTQQQGVRVRLVGGGRSEGTELAAIELDLAPGYKTYWRYPGDSGVPPRLDFHESSNVAAVEMVFPAPQRFPDGAGGWSIGYKGAVLFPLKVKLQDPDQPAELKVTFDFAVCEALCVPAEASVQLALPARAKANARIEAALSKVPRQDGDAESGLAIEAIRLEPQGAGQSIVVDVRGVGPGADLFVEGPNSDWALPLPQKTPLGEGKARFTLKADGVPKDATLAGTPLVLTLVDGERAIEIRKVPTLP